MEYESVGGNPINDFINYLDKNHKNIDQVYIFLAVIYVVLAIIFIGFFKGLRIGLSTLITTSIGIWVIHWLNRYENGKYHLFGWILVAMSMFSVFGQITNFIFAKPRQVAEQITQEAFRSFSH